MITHRRGHRRSKSNAHLLARTLRLKALSPGNREAVGSDIMKDTGSKAVGGIKNQSDVHDKLRWQKGKIKGPYLLIREPIGHAVQADEVIIALARAYDAIAVTVHEHLRHQPAGVVSR